jgi:hypothetical protein
MRHHLTTCSTVERLGEVSVKKSAAGVVDKPPFERCRSSSASSQIALASDRGRCIDGVTYQSSARPDSSSHSVWEVMDVDVCIESSTIF